MVTFLKRVSFLVLLFAVFVFGPISYARSEEAGNNELVIAINADIRGLDGFSRDDNTDTVMQHIYEGLVAFRSDLTVGPSLAESWAVSNDGRIYTFKIREGATFHNGDKVTAEDVIWSWNWLMDPAKSWLCKPKFDGSLSTKILSIDAVDEHRVAFTLAEPSGMFLTEMAIIQCHAWIISPKNVGEDGEWIEGSAIGTGSFVLEEWEHSDYVRLKAYDAYIPLKSERDGYAGDRTAYVDRVKFLVIPSSKIAETAIISGDVHVMNNLAPQRVKHLRRRGAQIMSMPGLAWVAILLQTEDELLSDIRIRKAIAHAIDYYAIAKIKTEGLTEENPTGVAQSSAYYTADMLESWPKYDVERAKALLKEAGYNGEKITIQTNVKYREMYENAIFLQAMLHAIGMNAHISTLEWGTQLNQFLSGKFQLQSFGFSAQLDPALAYGNFLGSKALDPSNQWENAAAHDLYRRSLTASKFDERRALFKQIQDLMAEDIPIIGLYYEPVVFALAANVSGFEIWPANKPIAWGVRLNN